MAQLFPGFAGFDIAVAPEVVIHGIQAGTGPPLLLIHGFPQTHHIWHKITPTLVRSFTVIAVDLRGYGQSSKPPSSASEGHRPYSKSSMASDCRSVMRSLGHRRFSVLAHDRGARVAHKLAVDYPDAVERLLLLDIAPTLCMFEQTDQVFATAYWHWFFLIQPAPFPERLLTSQPALFQARFFGAGCGGGGERGFLDEGAVAEYMGMFGDEQGVHAMCEDYRAAATIDLVEARRDRDAGRKIQCPVRVLWGRHGVIEKCFDCLGEWRAVSEGSVSGEAVESGHYIAEENPGALLEHVGEFLGGGSSTE
ncbi:hypothetical protein B2J93_3508 [Marssonina coronariae]|uniref:AB hydrolase-1 domain-containing protein n=1 Tax=Diplocarpon coronariae TaxID=2795749 RepID=A0A218Z4M5_9HELO|nr:hypothetical protein B2J93_3508 [Marssonina coronariae]